jgi:broad specificity phosphatase PhoE
MFVASARSTHPARHRNAILKIILVRHGRSSHVDTGWLNRDAVEAWLRAYDIAGLAPNEVPPEPLLTIAKRAGLIVASDLPRAIESATLLNPGLEIVQSPLLRETSLEIPGMAGLRLPITAWGLVIGLHWMMKSRAALVVKEKPVRERGRDAARWLTDLATTHDSVIAVTHGAFRRFLADALVANGWTPTPGKQRFHHWSAWEFKREGRP